MSAEGGVGSRIYSFGNTSSGGGGGGSSAFRPPVQARDSVNSAKPTGAVTIDSAPINITGQRVLFTNLSGPEAGDNNKVFTATVAAGLVTAWTLQTDGQAGDGNPTDGDNLYVKVGTVHGDTQVFFNGTAWFVPGGGANTALSNLTATGINQGLVADTNGTRDLGTAPIQWRRLFVQQIRDNISNTVIDVNNRILNDSANATAFNFSGTTNTVIHKNLVPNASASRDLGSTTAQFRDIFAANLKDAAGTVILDMATRFLGDSAGGPVLDFSNATNTVLYKNLIPSSNNTFSIGNSATIYNSVWSSNYRIGLNGSVFQGTTPTGATAVQLQAQTLGGEVGLTTVNNSTPDAVPTGDIHIESGNKTAGTGNSGNIFITSGTSTGGTRGNLFINVPSLAGSSVGWVWTLQDIATGRGAWVAAAATGANTTLSNLTSPTAINQTLRPDTTHSRDLGTSSLNWSVGYFGITAYSNASLALNGLIRGTNGVQIIDGDTYTANAYFLIEGAGATNNAPILIQTPNRNNLNTGRIVLVTGTDVNAAGLKTGDIKLITGDSFNGTGTGPTGDILLKTGVTAGARGQIRFQDASLASAAVGYVWTLQNAATGQGEWDTPPAPTGSNNTIAFFNGAGVLSSEANFIYDTSINAMGFYDTFTSGTATVSGAGAFLGGRVASGGVLTSSGSASFVFGQAFGVGGEISSTDTGTFAGGSANIGKILSENSGSFAFGNIGGNTASRIRATTGGGVAMGSAGDGAIILSSNAGAFALGSAFGGAGGTLTASGQGSHAFGAADGSSPTRISATALGSGARGYAQNNGQINSQGAGSWASGRVTGSSQLLASGAGAHVFGAAQTGGNITANNLGGFAGGFAEGTSSIITTSTGGFVYGYVATATMTSSGTGSFALGSSGSSANLTASGEGSLVIGRATGSSSLITATSTGSMARGNADSGGIIRARTELGAFASGVASGSGSLLQSEGQGAHSFGNVSGGSTITCGNNGALASGSATSGGSIQSVGAGSMAFGNSTGTTSLIQAANNGSFSFGNASLAGTIRTTGAGALAFGRALNTSALILGQGAGAMAFGYIDQATSIQATGQGSFAAGVVETTALNAITASGIASFAYGRRHNVSGNFASAFGEGHTVSSYGAFVVGQFADAVGTPTTSVGTEIAFAVGVGVAGTPANAFSIGKNADIKIRRTITPAATTGAQTIDRPSGTVNFAIGATTLVVTNNLVTTDSIIFTAKRTADPSVFIEQVVAGAGSFTITLSAAPTVEISVGFLVTN